MLNLQLNKNIYLPITLPTYMPIQPTYLVTYFGLLTYLGLFTYLVKHLFLNIFGQNSMNMACGKFYCATCYD